MNNIEFEGQRNFIPYTACVPLAWINNGFENLDFGAKQGLKTFVEAYLEQFDYQGKDSMLLLGVTDFAYKLFVSIYKEIASHIPVDTYKFIDWTEYVARIKGMGYKGDNQVIQDLYAANFVFIFDLFLSTEETQKQFKTIVEYAYLRHQKVFVATRMTSQELRMTLREDLMRLVETKFAFVKA